MKPAEATSGSLLDAVEVRCKRYARVSPSLRPKLYDPSLQDTGKAAQLSVAQCIAVLCIAAGGKQISSTVTKLLQALQAREAFSRHPCMLHQPLAACTWMWCTRHAVLS